MKQLVVFLSIFLGFSLTAEASKKETDIHGERRSQRQHAIYRGFTVANLEEKTLADARNLWHANQVRFMLCPIWRQQGLGAANYQESWKKLLADLPEGLDRAHKLGIAVIVDLHQIPNDNPQTYTGSRDEQSHAWWLDPSNLETLLDCWRELAQITAQRPQQAIWLEIYNEPLDWGYVHQHPSYPPLWPKWAQAAIDEIRKINTVHPILISTGPGMLCWGFKDFPPLHDPAMDVIYSLHMWQPLDFTHQGVNGQTIVPWMENGPDYIAKELQPAVDFQKKHNVRMHVGEFGAPRWAPGAQQYLRDCIEFFEKMGWDWNYHAFREAGVWCMETGEAVDLLDANDVHIKTGLAAENTQLRYRPYGQPMTGTLENPQGRTQRGQVLLEYLKRNLEQTEPANTLAAEPERYRGFTVCRLLKQDLLDIKNDWQGNHVRYMLCPEWRAPSWQMTQQQAFDKMLQELVEGLDNAKELGLMVIVDLHQIPMDTPPVDENGKQAPFWQHTAYRDKMIECWQRIARITAEREETIWLELYNEPLDYADFPSYPANLPLWMQETIDAIREIDTRHPIVVPTGPGMLCWGFTDFPLLDDPYHDIIYTLHLWQPVNYTHQGVSGNRPLAYPGDVNDSGGSFWDKRRLEFELLPAIRFQQQHGVRLYVGEFGAPRWAPDAERYLQDAIEIFEKYGWDWAYHAFREAGVWSAELDENIDLLDAQGNFIGTGVIEANQNQFYAPYSSPQQTAPETSTDNARAKVLKKFLTLNDRTEKRTIEKVLFVGGPITRKIPDTNFNWTRSCGASASAVENDYVHVLYSYLCQARPDLSQSEPLIASITDENTLTGYEHLLPCQADLIIIQLGENFWQMPSKDSLQIPYENLIQALRGDRDPLIVCIGLWDGGPRDRIIQEAAKNQFALYVPIAHLNALPQNHAIDEYQYQHHELNWLPGDQGMKAIADTIWEEIKHQVE